MNRTRVLLAGLAAGLVWIAVDFLIHGVLLANTHEALVASGAINSLPAWFLPLVMLANLCVGLVIAYLYASVRSTLGRGPWTALRLGLAAFVFYIPVLITQAALYKLGTTVNLASTIGALLQTMAANFVVVWLYRD